jgi:hypothetical protein
MNRLAGMALLCALAGTAPAHAQDAAALLRRHAGLHEVLSHNPFNRPLYLESSETDRKVQGDIYVEIAQSYDVAGPSLQHMEHWCDILILHLNVKGCAAEGSTLKVYMGRKFDQPLADTHLFEFLFAVETARADYLRVALMAAEGPLGTSHYRIAVEMAPIDGHRSFLHLSYAYDLSRTSRWAAQGYLATIGRAKVGFTVVRAGADGTPVYIDGTRGAVERNAMRCYVAIEAYLGALAAPAPQQVEKRLRDWYAGIEKYPLQLHELALDQYLDMKHSEIRRQQADVLSAAQTLPRSAPILGSSNSSMHSGVPS